MAKRMRKVNQSILWEDMLRMFLTEKKAQGRSDTTIHDEVINYPKVQTPDVVLAMSQEAYKKYGLTSSEAAILIIDNTYVQEYKERKGNFYPLPLTRVARSFGSEQSANVVALGAVAAISGLISLEEVRQAVRQRAPKGTGERGICKPWNSAGSWELRPRLLKQRIALLPGKFLLVPQFAKS